MKGKLVFFMVITTSVALAVAVPEEEKFTSKYDNVNIDDILHNERLFKKYVQCLLADNDLHCTPDGKELRKAIPDALTNDCAKCNEKQKMGTEKVIKHIRTNKPDDWEKLLAKWDPEGIYRKTLEEKHPEFSEVSS